MLDAQSFEGLPSAPFRNTDQSRPVDISDGQGDVDSKIGQDNNKVAIGCETG
jgi:hypothetical protein